MQLLKLTNPLTGKPAESFVIRQHHCLSTAVAAISPAFGEGDDEEKGGEINSFLKVSV